jgi:hypothetical protein
MSHCHFPVAPDDRRSEEQRVLKQFGFDIMLNVLQVESLVLAAIGVDEFFEREEATYRLKLATTQSLFIEVYELDGNPPFFEKPDRLLCVFALLRAEYLNSHDFVRYDTSIVISDKLKYVSRA